MHPQRTQLKRFKIKDKTLNQLIKYAVRKWYGQIYVECRNNVYIEVSMDDTFPE